MIEDSIVQVMELFTLAGVLAATVIFTTFAVKSKSIGSFKFQLSIFMLVWAAAEIPHIAETLGLIVVGSFDEIGLEIHMISMAIFAIFVGSRSIKFLKEKPVRSLIPPAQTVLPTGVMEK